MTKQGVVIRASGQELSQDDTTIAAEWEWIERHLVSGNRLIKK